MSSSLQSLCPSPAPVEYAERRAFPRYQPSTTLARVAWRDSGLRFEKTCASLLDVSEGGVRVMTSVYARVGRMVWVGLKSLPLEWVKAEVRSSELVGNQWVCRLEFREACPAGILGAALEPTQPVKRPIVSGWSFFGENFDTLEIP